MSPEQAERQHAARVAFGHAVAMLLAASGADPATPVFSDEAVAELARDCTALAIVKTGWAKAVRLALAELLTAQRAGTPFVSQRIKAVHAADALAEEALREMLGGAAQEDHPGHTLSLGREDTREADDGP